MYYWEGMLNDVVLRYGMHQRRLVGEDEDAEECEFSKPSLAIECVTSRLGNREEKMSGHTQRTPRAPPTSRAPVREFATLELIAMTAVSQRRVVTQQDGVPSPSGI